jgi:hypothetical protein
MCKNIYIYSFIHMHSFGNINECTFLAIMVQAIYLYIYITDELICVNASIYTYIHMHSFGNINGCRFLVIRVGDIMGIYTYMYLYVCIHIYMSMHMY